MTVISLCLSTHKSWPTTPGDNMIKYLSLAATLSLSAAALLPSSAFAHHGSNGQFDTAAFMQVSGTVTKIRYVNPHSYVYFDSVGEDGKVNAWRCELSSGSSHKRRGWTEDMFAAGTKITIDGSPARREEFGCYTRTITFEDGTKIGRQDTIDSGGKAVPEPRVLTVKGKPNFDGTWVAERQERAPRPTGGDAGAMGGPPGGDTGAMGGPPNGMGGDSEYLGMSTRYKMTDANIAASQNFKRDDNPRFHCQASNLFHDWSFDQNVNEIETLENVMVIRYGFMDIVRTIHIGMKAHPKDIVPSRAGHSIAHWDNGALVVDTIGFEEGYLEGGPRSVAKHSDALHVTERFTMSKDGSTLNRTYEIEDAKFLKESFKGEDSVKYTQDAFSTYECEDLTEEVVSGF